MQLIECDDIRYLFSPRLDHCGWTTALLGAGWPSYYWGACRWTSFEWNFASAWIKKPCKCFIKWKIEQRVPTLTYLENVNQIRDISGHTDQRNEAAEVELRFFVQKFMQPLIQTQCLHHTAPTSVVTSCALKGSAALLTFSKLPFRDTYRWLLKLRLVAKCKQVYPYKMGLPEYQAPKYLLWGQKASHILEYL